MPLKVVSENPLPEPPYPADTKANGWKPEIDYDRIKQSRTWLLCPLHYRPWLLMLWVESWASVPAGSLPDDDEMLAARIGMDFEVFEVAKKYLMRGWKMANDGNFYHQFITDQVLMMLSKRKKTADRVNRYRETKKQQLAENVTRYKNNVTHNQRVSNAQEQEQEQEQDSYLTTPNGVVCPQKSANLRKNCPHQKIIDLYHQQCPTLPEVRSWEGQRPQHLRARWQKHPDLDWWKGFFEYIAESKFLTGRVQPKGDSSPFFATLEWIIRPTNFQRITEGYYHR